MFLCKQGYSLLPLRPASKIPYMELLPATRTGQASWSLYQLRPASESEVKDWFIYDPACNYGILTGPASIGGLYVLDVDQVKQLPAKEIPPTVTVKTGRGFHYYFRSDQELQSKAFNFGELKGINSYIVGPGSVHESGQVYEFIEMLGPVETDIEILPEWVLNVEAARASSPSTAVKQDPLTYKPKEHKRQGVVRKNSLTCYTSLWHLNRDPEIAFKVMKLCGREVDRIGKAFKCPIPGHSEKRASVALWQGADVEDAVVLHDFHKRDPGRVFWPLVDVYASVKVGKALELKKGERAIWWLRALHEIGAVNPPVLKGYELPQEAPESARKLYQGFIYLMELRQLYEPQDSAPLSWTFAAAWCGIGSYTTVAKAMRYLLERGYLYMKQPGVKIGEGDGPRSALFAIGRPRPEIKK